MTNPNPSPDTRFEKGKSGNPKGRPKGSRNKLGEQFLQDLLKDWEESGSEALVKCRETKPADYVRVVASILPKELNVKVDPLEDLDDAELDRRVKQLASEVLGVSQTAPGEAEASEGKPSKGLSSLH